MKTQFYSGIFLLLFITMLAACGGGYDVSGGEYCNRGSITIIEPAGNCSTYITKTSFIGLSGYAFVSPKGVDCHHIFPSQLNLNWHNTSTGQTGRGSIFSYCLPSFFGSIPSTRWGIGAGRIDFQLGTNVIDLTVTDQLDRRSTGTITIVLVNDIEAPRITSSSPASNAIDVPNNRNLTVRFSEEMLSGSLTDERFIVVDESGFPVSGQRSYDEANFTWLFNPSINLLYSTTYTITIGGGVEDRYGGNVLGADVSWSFTTGPSSDVTSPKVIQINPGPGSLCAGTGTTVLARFDEPLDSNTVNATTFLLKDSVGILVPGSVTYDGVTARLMPDVTLTSGGTYEVTLTAAIRDLAKNPLGADYSWTFTTEGGTPVGGWVPTSTANAPYSRTGHSAVWTGTEMIVWGGTAFIPSGSFGSYVQTNTGGRYDPVADSWTATSTLNTPIGAEGHTAVWTGSKMIIWGGNTDTGKSYDPGTDSWQTLSKTNAPSARSRHIAVWTGTEMIIWGGSTPDDSLPLGKPMNSGGLYDPSTDSWRAMSTAGALSPRVRMAAAWTGTELIVWGGRDGNGLALGDGARYNPQTDTWVALPTTNAPGYGNTEILIWTGTEILAWNGGRATTVDSYGFPRNIPRLRIYNPVTDTWRGSESNCEPYFPAPSVAYWTGDRMLALPYISSFSPSRDPNGYFYNPITDEWQSIATMGAPGRIGGYASIWASDRFILWGGSRSGISSDAGFVFRE